MNRIGRYLAGPAAHRFQSNAERFTIKYSLFRLSLVIYVMETAE